MCLLATIRGIRNLVSSLSSIEGSTIRGREGIDTGVGKRRVRVAVNLEMPSVRGTVTYCRLAMINWNFKFYFPFNFRAQSLINCVRSSRMQMFDSKLGYIAAQDGIKYDQRRVGTEDERVDHFLSLSHERVR